MMISVSWKFWLFITIAQICAAWPSKTFAPYVDILSWPTLDVSQVAKSTGHKHFTLAFVVADSAGAPTWGGVIPMAQNFYATQLASLRALGGEVIVSFGGANGIYEKHALTGHRARIRRSHSKCSCFSCSISIRD